MKRGVKRKIQCVRDSHSSENEVHRSEVFPGSKQHFTAKHLDPTLPGFVDEITATLEEYLWLVGTHHRDFDDMLVYKTIKVYLMRFQGANYIVGDRLVRLRNDKYSGKGDCKGIHIRDIEKYTIAFTNKMDGTLDNVPLLHRIWKSRYT